MALTTATITFNVSDMLGVDFDIRRTKAWTSTNVDNDTLIDTAANQIRMGDGKAVIGTDGTGSFSVWVPGTGANPASWQTYFHFDYVMPGSRERTTRTFGPFTLTGSADLADLEAEQAIPPNYQSAFLAQAQSYLDQQESLAGIDDSDSATAYNTQYGPLTKAALSASIGAQVDTSGSALNAALAKRAVLNILDPIYGVSTGTTASQTAAVKAALDANPGKAFYFPPGDYRLDTQLDVTKNNTLIIDGRIYAGDFLDTLINWDNGLTVTNYALGKAIVGNGIIDCALKARRGIAIGSVIGFTVGGTGLQILDPINRGLWLKPAGAEVYVTGLRMKNTGTTNAGSNPSVTTTAGSTGITGTFLATDVGSPIIGAGIPVGAWLASITSTTQAVLSAPATGSGTTTAAILSNIGVEADMGDCTISHLAPRDFTVGVWDKGSNRFNDVHAWIGTSTQQAARYPNSSAFLLASASILTDCESDSMRRKISTAHPGRTVNVTTTNGSTAITSAAGIFSSDRGAPIVGPGIPAGATISAWTDTSNATLSVAATASGTVAATVLGGRQAQTIQLKGHKGFTLTPNVPDALAAANPGVIFDLQDGAKIAVIGGRYQGHGNTADLWTAGVTTRLTITTATNDVPGSVTGFSDYRRGVKLGRVDFAPTFYSHVTGLGSVNYAAGPSTTPGGVRTGRMQVGDGVVTYTGRIAGTQGADATGNYRIGNLPFVAGAVSVSLSDVGVISRRAGVASAAGAFGANGTSGTLIAIVNDGAGAEIPVVASQAFDIHFTIVCPFTYPSDL